MPRWLRWVLYVASFFVVLQIAGYGLAQYYKPKILTQLNEQIKSKINGEVYIGALDFTIFKQFPQVSITLTTFYLRGPKYAVYHCNFLQAEKIFIQVNPSALLGGIVDVKSVVVQNGNLFIFKTATGYTNLDIFKKPTSTEASGASVFSVEISNLQLQNFHALFADSLKQKSHEVTFINTRIHQTFSANEKEVVLSGPVTFGGLTFNPQRGSYLKGKSVDLSLSLKLDSGNQHLQIHSSKLVFQKSVVTLSGEVGLGANGKLLLNIQAPMLDYAEGLSIVTSSLKTKLEKFYFHQQIQLSVIIDGQLAGGEPKLSIDFAAEKNRFTTGVLEATDFSFQGSFSNEVDSLKERDDANSRISLPTFSAKINGVATQGRMMLSDLDNPQLQFEVICKGELTDLNINLDTTQVQFKGGTYQSNLSFAGKLDPYLHPTDSFEPGLLQGSALLTNASIEFPSKEKKLGNGQIQFHFHQHEVLLEKSTFEVNDIPVELTGKLTNLIPFIFNPEAKGFFGLSLYAHHLNLAKLIRKKNVVKKAMAPKQNKVTMLDRISRKLEFSVQLKAEEITNGAFSANNFTGNFSLLNDQLKASQLSMKLAGGNIRANFNMENVHAANSTISLQTEINNSDIRKLFSAFSNFKQKAILAENISGAISAQLKLGLEVDEQFGLKLPSLKGDATVKIRNGKLENVEALEKMGNFLFKKRDFSEVDFAEINGRFTIAGPNLVISRIEIQSTVLGFFIMGQYSLADSTDMSIQIPLSNLKRRDKNFKPENIGSDAKAGISVYLRARSIKGKTVISYDPFKRGVKKK